jgi:hypothetical protein
MLLAISKERSINLQPINFDVLNITQYKLVKNEK